MSSRKPTSNKDTTETTIPTTEPPAAEVKDHQPGFAERVKESKWVPAPDPFGIASDNLAGVRLFESKRDRQMAIQFGEGRPEDKPSQAVIDRLKEAGYRWVPADRIWAHPVRGDSAMSTRIDAEWLYQGDPPDDPAGEGHRAESGHALLTGRRSVYDHAPDLLPARPRPPGPADGTGLHQPTVGHDPAIRRPRLHDHHGRGGGRPPHERPVRA
jgi:hypothetical protein